jgi:hypothetical protein
MLIRYYVKATLNTIQMKKKQIGNITTVKFDITEPMKMQTEIEFKNLSIFVGQNGSGKTLIMKMIWFMNTVAAAAIKYKMIPVGLSLEDIAQFTMDHTFDNNNFEGSLQINYENGSIEVAFVGGKVVGVNPELEGLSEMATPIFMSKDARTFSQIKMIMQMKSTMTQEQMLKMVKLYDIVYVEYLSAKLKDTLVLSEPLKSSLEDYGMVKHDIQSLKLKDDSVYFTNSKGEDHETINLSAGEQSILNMMIGAGHS